MDNRFLRTSSILGLSLGVLVLGVHVPAQAEPTRADEPQAAAGSAEATKSAEVTKQDSQQTTELTVKTVSLAADMDTMKKRVNRPLMITGASLFGIGWVPTVFTGLAASKQTSGWLAVPVVGPWIDWGPDTSPGNKTLLFASGLLQAVGVGSMIGSFFVPESKTEKVPLMGKRRFTIAPVAGNGNYAVSATGTF